MEDTFTSISYVKDIHVQYETNEEYQQCILSLVSLQPYWPTQNEDQFDAITEFIDFIYKQTHEIPEFQLIYEKASATMFSTNLQIGLVILFSFDYLKLFHSVLCAFINNDTEETKNESIQQLCKLLSP